MKRQILAEELAKLKGEILESQKEKKESIEEPIEDESTIEDQATPDE